MSEAAGLIVAAGTIAATLLTSLAYLTKKIKECRCCGCACKQATEITDPNQQNDYSPPSTPNRANPMAFFATHRPKKTSTDSPHSTSLS